MLPRRAVFWLIYRRRGWDTGEGRSGTGSTLHATRDVRDELPRLLRDCSIGTMLDAACGDFHWLSQVDLPCGYIGVEIVGGLVQHLADTHGSPRRQFMQADICRDVLPRADLILCRDALVHLPTRDVMQAIRNFKASGSTYLLVTHHTRVQHIADIPIGDWRAINFELPPFSFPAPLRIIHERTSVRDDKTLALWRLADLALDDNRSSATSS